MGECPRAQRRPRQGAEFVVELPLEANPQMRRSRGSRRGTIRRRVLIIEDNIDAADSLREVLAFGDHIVEVAYNGPEGLARPREFKPEVVLCDIACWHGRLPGCARLPRRRCAERCLPRGPKRLRASRRPAAGSGGGLTDTSPSHQHRKDRGGAGIREIPMNDRAFLEAKANHVD